MNQQPPAVTINPETGQPFGPTPQTLTCPACHNKITTTVKTQPNLKTHVFALILCVVGFICCWCFIPYCIKSCQSQNHYCPRCNALVGSYQATT